ncbi:ABC transporter ATP-binding protein [Octadecabacter sp. G9-8]|uniref:ABC transporter ATP-binding protein n=1 Tax=Octadecabacter dasysiphoniae TaxID=2909341 RepID=A0ABS9CUX0_9RHOB|nr:ABC transporter ATP-binding protein [Octadecabacter dasysiphoniae]MCF2870958.1 ABC transporter ATP-binding protein [Octadecabacter dasysiphoniae]
MIHLQNLSKTYWSRGAPHRVIDDLTITLPTGRSIALLGANGAGKSTLLQMISGLVPPDTGELHSDGTISWPVGLGNSFHPQMSGEQNTRFVARVYGVDTDELIDFVYGFSELGAHFLNPVKTYSSGMRARLAFGLSMGIQFDTYLIDETTSVGDARFNRKSRAVFMERIKHASAIMVSHQTRTIREFCDSGLVLHNGKAHYFDVLEDAITAHLDLNG